MLKVLTFLHSPPPSPFDFGYDYTVAKYRKFVRTVNIIPGFRASAKQLWEMQHLRVS